jgi:hypothetical protein
METMDPAGRRGTGPAHWSLRAPLLVAAVLIGLISASNIGRHLQARAPRDSWEAIEVMEAWRSLRGLPVYDLSPDGHATHFYGALVPWVQGEIFRWVGPNNVSGRVLTFVSALATIALIAVATRVKGSAWLPIVVCAALLGLNHRSGQYFVANRPDMTALFFATAAVMLMGLGVEKRRGGLVVASAACLIVGFFFKQTAAAFAAVPPIALTLRGRRPRRAEVLWALLPMAAVVGVILYLRAFCPAVYYYMIEVPGSYRIEWFRVLDGLAWRMLLASPLFLILVGEWLAADRGSLRDDPRMPWVVAVLAVAIPSSAAAYGKYGGATNSLLPALLAMIAFCALRIPTALHRLEGRVASRFARTLLGSFAAVLLFLTAFPRLQFMTDLPPWNTGYDKVVASVSGLRGTVVCPEDPTIPMYAKAHAGRALAAELDSHAAHGGWPDTVPETVVDEVRRADFLVDIRESWDDQLAERDLRRLGLEPADDLMPDVSSYRLWRRAAAAGARGTERTAWHAAVAPSPYRASRE